MLEHHRKQIPCHVFASSGIPFCVVISAEMSSWFHVA